MKRFWKEVATEPADGGWRVTLDGRPMKTQGGAPQI
ncbi:MAG: molecular chaperone, partial [Sphingomonadales bacterium]